MNGFNIDLVSLVVLPITKPVKTFTKELFHWKFLTKSKTHFIAVELQKQYGFPFGWIIYMKNQRKSFIFSLIKNCWSNFHDVYFVLDFYMQGT